MSDESTWLADGDTLYFSPKPSASFVGLHNATLARHIAEWHNAQLAGLVAEVEQWHATNRDAVQALAKSEAKLNEAIERIGYVERMLEHLRSAAQPAVGLMIDIGHLPLDPRTRETIQQTLAPLEAALAASAPKARE